MPRTKQEAPLPALAPSFIAKKKKKKKKKNAFKRAQLVQTKTR